MKNRSFHGPWLGEEGVDLSLIIVCTSQNRISYRSPGVPFKGTPYASGSTYFLQRTGYVPFKAGFNIRIA